MNQSKRITDGALLVAIFIVLLIIAVFVPLAILIVLFLLPIPFIIYTSKHDWKPALVMLGVAVLLTLLFATFVSLPLTILVGLGGIMIGSAIHHNLTAYETWARGTLGFVAGLVFIFLFSQLVLDVNWANEIDLIIDDSMQMSQDIMEQTGFAIQTDEQLKLLKEQISLIKNLLPVGMAMISILLAFISQWVGYKMINRLENKQLSFPPFRTLQFPVAVIWIYFIALIFTFFELDANSVIYLAVYNVFTLTGLFMALQGFSFIFFFAHHKGISKVFPIIGVIITLLLPFIFLYLVRIIGIIDIGFSLRDRISKGKK